MNVLAFGWADGLVVVLFAVAVAVFVSAWITRDEFDNDDVDDDLD